MCPGATPALPHQLAPNTLQLIMGRSQLRAQAVAHRLKQIARLLYFVKALPEIYD